jgi:hypothetical protein
MAPIVEIKRGEVRRAGDRGNQAMEPTNALHVRRDVSSIVHISQI